MMENPLLSDLWTLPEVQSALAANETWKLTRVDQCAYGRGSQKPTTILHNTQWKPVGLTGNGRCKIGACAGTCNNEPGDRRHKEQTIPATKERRPCQGTRDESGRREHTKKAVVNSVAPLLPREIYRAVQGQQGVHL